MSGVWLRYRTGLRQSWRAWLLLGLLCGLAMSLVLAAVADGRRTSSALERHLAAYRSPDAAVAVDQTKETPEAITTLLAQVDRLPQVERSAKVQGVNLEVMDAQGQFIPAFDFGSALGKLVDEHAISEVGAFDLISGRFPTDDQPDEVMVNPTALDAGGWAIGDVVDPFRVYRPLTDFDADGNADPAKGEPLTLTIVGVAQRPDELVDDSEVRQPQVYLFPAFGRKHADTGFYLIDYVRLHNGSADEVAFQQAAAAISATTQSDPLRYSSFTDAVRHANQSRRPQVVAIWLLAGVLLVAALFFSLQSIARSLSHHYADMSTLRSLGMSRRSIVSAITLHAVSIAMVVALVAVLGGYAFSAFTPFGATGDIEPHPGLEIDVTALGFGAVIIVVSLTVLLAVWGWRMVGRAMNGSPDGEVRVDAGPGPASVGLVGRIRSGVISSTAARFAFQPSPSRTSVALGAITGSVALGIALFTGGLTFASSLDAVLRTPNARGWNWDVELVNSFGTIPDDALQYVIENEQIDEATAFTTGTLMIDGHRQLAMGIDQKTGALYLSMVKGRAPQSANEIILGSATLDAIHRSLGDEVQVVTPKGTRSMVIVGVARFPAIGSGRFGSLSLGDGAATIASVIPSSDPTGTYSGLLLRLIRGRSRDDQINQLRGVVAQIGCKDDSCFVLDTVPPQLAGYDDVRSIWLPFGLALAALVVIPLGYGIISSVRARRRELSVMRALGMTHRQVSGVIVLHAIWTVVVSIVAGLLIGIFAAQLGWWLFSKSIGVEWPLDVPVPALMVVAAGSALAALLIVAAVAVTPMSRRCDALR
ncbi:MAG: FtsX-like permease family protein [Ilumatobacteraceae bacterium]